LPAASSPAFGGAPADRLFLAFGVAFVLLALNQALAWWLGDADERVGYTYLLRVLGFASFWSRSSTKTCRGAALKAPLSEPGGNWRL
jgi:hypothetical protein